MNTLAKGPLVGEAYYKKLVEMSPDAMIVTDALGRVVMANARAAELWGVSDPGELIGKEGLMLISAEDRAQAAEGLRMLVQEAKRIHAEYSVVRADGARLAIETSASLLREVEGAPFAVLAIARDITERKRAEAALRTSEAQHAAVADLGWWALKGTAIKDLMNLAVSTVAQTLSVEFAAIHELVSTDGSLVVRAGFGWPDRLTGMPSPTDTELRQKYRVVSSISAILQGQTATIGLLSAHSRHQQAFTPDAAHFLQSVANVVAAAIERDRWEEALRTREQEFRALVENAQDLIARFGSSRDVRYLNPVAERAVGQPLRDIEHTRARDLPLPPAAAGALDLGLEQVFETGREQLLELLLPSPSGDRYYQTRLIPEFDTEHNVKSVLVVARDITQVRASHEERELLFRELMRAQESLQSAGARLRGGEQSGESDDVPELSRREREILRLVAEGLTNQAIGARLAISAGTVKNHLRNVLPKLNAVSRTQAVARALDLGLLTREEIERQ